MVKQDAGVARNGLHEWYWQRLSAVLLILLLPIPFILILLVATGHMDQLTLLGLLDSPLARLLHSLLMIALLAHAYLGVRVVLEDYVHRLAVRIPLMGALRIGMFSLGLWGFAMIWAWNG